jgi:hypothetical protein
MDSAPWSYLLVILQEAIVSYSVEGTGVETVSRNGRDNFNQNADNFSAYSTCLNDNNWLTEVGLG